MAKQRLITTYYTDETDHLSTVSYYICNKTEWKQIKREIKQFFENNPGQIIKVPVGDGLTNMTFTNADDVFGNNLLVEKISEEEATIIEYRLNDDLGFCSIRDVMRAIDTFVPQEEPGSSYGFRLESGSITIPYNNGTTSGGWVTTTTTGDLNVNGIVTANGFCRTDPDDKDYSNEE